MLEFAAGIAVGAAFAPFWMWVWKLLKSKLPSSVPPPPTN